MIGRDAAGPVKHKRAAFRDAATEELFFVWGRLFDQHWGLTKMRVAVDLLHEEVCDIRA